MEKSQRFFLSISVFFIIISSNSFVRSDGLEVAEAIDNYFDNIPVVASSENSSPQNNSYSNLSKCLILENGAENVKCRQSQLGELENISETPKTVSDRTLEMGCSTFYTFDPLILFLILLLTILTITVLATIYDLKTKNLAEEKRNQLILSFSAYTNSRNLIDIDNQHPDTIRCMHGIRVIAILLIILLHSMLYRLYPPNNKKPEVQEWLQTGFASSISAINVVVDSFFLMSAALVARSMMKELERKKFNFPKMVFLRYMRLTPSIAIMILLNHSLAQFLKEKAPPNFLEYSVIPCQKFWWSTLLHLQVYTNPREMCMHTTWYISVEWQMTVLVAPPLIYLLWKFGRKAQMLIYGLISVSILSAIFISSKYDFIIKDINMTTDFRGKFYEELYYPTHIRGIPSLLGVLLGYRLHFLEKRKSQKLSTTVYLFFVKLCHPLEGIDLTLAKFVVWAAVFLMSSNIIFISWIFTIIGRNSALNSVLFGTFRVMWAYGTAVIIYGSQLGAGGVVEKFLSWKYWIPIGKLGLSIYLMHPVLMYNFIVSRDSPLELETVGVLINFMGDLILTLPIAVLFFLLVEEPFSLFGKNLSRIFWK